MTIAAGFICNEGIVLCADSQHTISGYTKEYDGKVRTTLFHHPNEFVMAMAGSGTTDYIKMAMDKACENFDKRMNHSQIKELLEDNLLKFFHKHLGPWAYFPESERPTAELLIGISHKNGAGGLFHYTGTSFHRVSVAKAIGAGVLLANSLLHPYSFGLTSLVDISSSAIYILNKVKKQVDTCGGFTDLTVLKKGRAAIVSSVEIEKLEKKYDDLERQANRRLRDEIVANHPEPFWWLGDKTAGLNP